MERERTKILNIQDIDSAFNIAEYEINHGFKERAFLELGFVRGLMSGFYRDNNLDCKDYLRYLDLFDRLENKLLKKYNGPTVIG